MMKLRKPRKNLYIQTQQSKRCGTLSQLCVILLCVLVIFYITVASYLIPSSQNYRHRYDDDTDQHFIRMVPLAPKIDPYKIPNIPQNKHENKKFAPPEYDPKDEARYLNLQHSQNIEKDTIKSNHKHHKHHDHKNENKNANDNKHNNNIDIPSINIPENDYSNFQTIEQKYRDKCPEKFPKKIPEIYKFT
eukprot:861085_1